MYDALTIAAIADELAATIVRGRVQRVQHGDELTLSFEIYARGRRRWITVSADPQDARIVAEDGRPPVDSDTVSPMLLLLRKYVRGARVLAVDQPRFERILRITLAQADYDEADEDAPPELIINDLMIELMGRHSNIILVDETGRIRDSVKHVTPGMSRVRTVMPGNAYAPPPPQDKLDPTLAGPSDLLVEADGDTSRLDRWLVATFLGISPLLAREILYRTGLEADAEPRSLSVADAEALLRAMRAVLQPLDSGAWSPALYHHDGGATFYAIPLHHLSDRDDVTIEPMDSILAAAGRAYQLGSPADTRPDRHAPRRARLVAEIDAARERLQRRVANLERQARDTASPEELRQKGELIYAYLWMIEPGMDELVTPDGLKIELDPNLSANDNAQAYFERYRKAQSAAEEIPRRLEATRQQLEYVEQLRLNAEQAESYDEIESVRMEWQEFAAQTQGVGTASRPGGSRPAQSARRPRRIDLDSGATIWIGRTGKQNDTVTFDIGLPTDLWLHARDMPGAHVILRPAPGREPSDRDVEIAASLAAYYSAGRSSGRVPIDVTERRNVRKIRGAGPGMVTYRGEYTIDVEPRSEEQLQLAAR